MTFAHIETLLNTLIECKNFEEIQFDHDFFGSGEIPPLFEAYLGTEPFVLDCYSMEYGPGYFRMAGKGQIAGKTEQVEIHVFEFENEVRFMIDIGVQFLSDFTEDEWLDFCARKDPFGEQKLKTPAFQQFEYPSILYFYDICA